MFLALFVDQVNHCHPCEKPPVPVGRACLKQVLLPGVLADSPALGARLFIGSQKTHISRDPRGHLFYKYLAVLTVPKVLPVRGASEDKAETLEYLGYSRNVKLLSKTQSEAG